MSTDSTGWRRSSHSDPNGDCVEVARTPSNSITLRDYKAATGPFFTFSNSQWVPLLSTLRTH